MDWPAVLPGWRALFYDGGMSETQCWRDGTEQTSVPMTEREEARPRSAVQPGDALRKAIRSGKGEPVSWVRKSGWQGPVMRGPSR